MKHQRFPGRAFTSMAKLTPNYFAGVDADKSLRADKSRAHRRRKISQFNYSPVIFPGLFLHYPRPNGPRL